MPVTIEIKLDAEGRIVRAPDPLGMVAVDDSIRWTCKQADFAVVNIQKLCDPTCGVHPDHPFTTPLSNKLKAATETLESPPASSQAKGCVYKATFVTRRADGTIDVWDPHFVVWP